MLALCTTVLYMGMHHLNVPFSDRFYTAPEIGVAVSVQPHLENCEVGATRSPRCLVAFAAASPSGAFLLGQASHLGCFLGQRHVTVGDFLDKGQVWVVQHDMEVFYSVHRLEAFPVLEPDDLVAR